MTATSDSVEVKPIKQTLDLNATVEDLRLQLNSLSVDARGNKATLKARLAKIKKHGLPVNCPSQKELLSRWREMKGSMPLRYLVVIDFEATCDEPGSGADMTPEIIEFPTVLIDLTARSITDIFTTFIRPVHGQITPFCERLTGIRPSDVEAASSFEETLPKLTDWLNRHTQAFTPSLLESDKSSLEGLHGAKYRIGNWCLVSDGTTDFETFLVRQVELSGVEYPAWTLGPYLDSRALFGTFTKLGRLTLLQQLSHLGMQFEGRQHRGLDDAVNIARVVLELVRRGCKIEENRFLDRHERGRLDKHSRRSTRGRRRS